uniref:Low density lipoprotein receptor-related protein 11 n=1 Tax=Scophthalmus maximus TaxID=52904 RepID=A0A8D2ZPC9_SCOMX
MAPPPPPQHLHLHLHLQLLLLLLLLLARVAPSSAAARSSPISDLKSKISGVEELLEEFRLQLQQDQAHREAEALDADPCARDFDAAPQRIIRTKASIERGATFLLAPERVATWRQCLRVCCAQPHCTVAVVQEEARRPPGDGLSCYLCDNGCCIDITYACDGTQHCPDRSDEDFCPNCTAHSLYRLGGGFVSLGRL